MASEEAYYWINKNQFTFKELGLVKISDRENVSKNFNARLLCVDGNWRYFSGNRNEITSREISNFPSNAEIIYDFGRGSYLLKIISEKGLLMLFLS